MTTVATIALVATTSTLDLLFIYHRIVILLPTGAFTLGVLCGSGYGVAGWFLTRLRFTVPMLQAIAVSMLLAYVSIVVVEYVQNAPRRMGFFEYFDTATQLATLRSPPKIGPELFEPREETPPAPLGADGYGYRLFELLGLTLGGMGGLFVVPAIRRRLDLR